MSSAIWPARRKLFELLQANAELTGIQLTLGIPADEEEQEVIAILGVTDSSEEEKGLGGNRKKEEFTVEVKVKVYDPTATTAEEAFALETRAGELLDEVRAVVHGDRDLGGVLKGNVASVVGTPTTGAQPAQGGGYVVFASAMVRCRATVSDG